MGKFKAGIEAALDPTLAPPAAVSSIRPLVAPQVPASPSSVRASLTESAH